MLLSFCTLMTALCRGVIEHVDTQTVSENYESLFTAGCATTLNSDSSFRLSYDDLGIVSRGLSRFQVRGRQARDFSQLCDLCQLFCEGSVPVLQNIA